MLTACTDSEKAEVLGNFFAIVFNRESEFAEASTTQPRPCQFSSRDLYQRTNYIKEAKQPKSKQPKCN